MFYHSQGLQASTHTLFILRDVLCREKKKACLVLGKKASLVTTSAPFSILIFTHELQPAQRWAPWGADRGQWGRAFPPYPQLCTVLHNTHICKIVSFEFSLLCFVNSQWLLLDYNYLCLCVYIVNNTIQSTHTHTQSLKYHVNGFKRFIEGLPTMPA